MKKTLVILLIALFAAGCNNSAKNKENLSQNNQNNNVGSQASQSGQSGGSGAQNGSQAETTNPTLLTPGNPTPLAVNAQAYSVGYLMAHRSVLLGKIVKIVGYELSAPSSGYIILSDEKSGQVNSNDLPATGAVISQVVLQQKYVFVGKLINGGLASSNKNPYHFELISAAKAQ